MARKINNVKTENFGSTHRVLTVEMDDGARERIFTAVKIGGGVRLFNGRWVWGVPADNQAVSGHQVVSWREDFAGAARLAVGLAGAETGPLGSVVPGLISRA